MKIEKKVDSAYNYEAEMRIKTIDLGMSTSYSVVAFIARRITIEDQI